MTKFRETDVDNYFIDSKNNVYMCTAYITQPFVELVKINSLEKILVEASDNLDRFDRLIVDPEDLKEDINQIN